MTARPRTHFWTLFILDVVQRDHIMTHECIEKERTRKGTPSAGQGTVRSDVKQIPPIDDGQTLIQSSEIPRYMRTERDAYRAQSSSTIVHHIVCHCVVVSTSRREEGPPHRRRQKCIERHKLSRCRCTDCDSRAVLHNISIISADDGVPSCLSSS